MKTKIVQMNSKSADIEENSDKIKSYINSAKDAELVIFPSLAITGSDCRDYFSDADFIEKQNAVLDEIADMELSLGDFVMTGGELPAMAVIDTVSRLIPGVLANEGSYENESHFNGLLEYPQYTRPPIWNGHEIPEILISGHHANIEKWKREQSLLNTLKKRPDMLEKADLTEEDMKFLERNGYKSE